MPLTEALLRISRTSGHYVAPATLLRSAMQLIYARERIPPSRAVSFVLCSNRAIRGLNARYRSIDRVTDVLSFTMGDDDLLGEIYVSFPRAQAQAREYGCTVREELLRLFIHGLYHLLGYDHENERDRRRMERKEAQVIKLMENLSKIQ